MWFALVFVSGMFVGAVLTVLTVLWYTIPRIERLYVFRPARDILRTPRDLGVPFEQCFIDVSETVRLSAWHLCPPKPVASVLYFHGNGGNLGILNEILAMLYRHDVQVFAIDYRGYGWSTGVPSEHGVYQDALAAIQYFNANFKRLQIPLIYWGRSLGAAVASFAAGKLPPSGLVLETAFPSKESLLEHYPRLKPFKPFSKYEFDSAAHLRNHQFPVLLVHGDKDQTVPLKQGQLLFSQLTGPKDFFRIEGAGHMDIHMKDSERYMQRVLKFFRDVEPVTIH